MIFVWLLACICLFTPLHLADATPGPIDKRAIYQLLQLAQHDAVRALPAGQREIFLATIAMNKGNTREALVFLSAKVLKKDRLASLIKAEAYRRQSVQAAVRAGHYAHAVNADIGKLKQASIRVGLDEANKSLDAFLVSLNKPKLLTAIPKSASSQPIPSRSVPPQPIPSQSISPQPMVIALAESKRRATTPHTVIESSTSIVENVVLSELAARSSMPQESIQEISSKLKPATLQPTTRTRKQHNIAPKSAYEAIESWRKDWQSGDSKAYLSHYDKAFKTLKHDYASWVQYKRRVNGKKSYIKVKLSNIKVFPSSNNIKNGESVLVTFQQQYQSSNYNSTSRKQIYMARKNNNAAWLILYEGDGN